jgi:hypothetical protein
LSFRPRALRRSASSAAVKISSLSFSRGVSSMGEASLLPFRVDLVDAAGLSSGLRERVRAEARLL